MSEFSLIDRYFATATTTRDDVVIGIGDDGAILQPPAGQQLVVATDTLVAGVHFPLGTSAEAIGHKALAVNLSDLAAMGATPAWALLALTLPTEDPAWLTAFTTGFGRLAEQFKVALVGGDTTRGPLTITVQVIGTVPAKTALTRGGAAPGDKIFITGSLGDAALALYVMNQQNPASTSDVQSEIKPLSDSLEESLVTLRHRLDFPAPQVEAGMALRLLATSAIDVSDGLLADLGHILAVSGVGAELVREQIPRTESFISTLNSANIPTQTGWQLAFCGGDDYQLCFTLPPSRLDEALNRDWSFCGGITEIGTVTAGNGIELVDASGQSLPLADFTAGGGYDHFS